VHPVKVRLDELAAEVMDVLGSCHHWPVLSRTAGRPECIHVDVLGIQPERLARGSHCCVEELCNGVRQRSGSDEPGSGEEPCRLAGRGLICGGQRGRIPMRRAAFD